MDDVNKLQMSWNEKKLYLKKLVKEISDLHGGDEPGWLNKYIQDLIRLFYNRLDDAIVCFESAHPECQRVKYLESVKGDYGQRYPMAEAQPKT